VVQIVAESAPADINGFTKVLSTFVGAGTRRNHDAPELYCERAAPAFGQLMSLVK
jgi:hypothetical protein